MSPVQSVTDVPVHSLPLVAFAVVLAFQGIRAGVAGRNETVTKLYAGTQFIAGQLPDCRRLGSQSKHNLIATNDLEDVTHRKHAALFEHSAGKPWTAPSMCRVWAPRVCRVAGHRSASRWKTSNRDAAPVSLSCFL